MCLFWRWVGRWHSEVPKVLKSLQSQRDQIPQKSLMLIPLVERRPHIGEVMGNVSVMKSTMKKVERVIQLSDTYAKTEGIPREAEKTYVRPKI